MLWMNVLTLLLINRNITKSFNFCPILHFLAKLQTKQNKNKKKSHFDKRDMRIFIEIQEYKSGHTMFYFDPSNNVRENCSSRWISCCRVTSVKVNINGTDVQRVEYSSNCNHASVGEKQFYLCIFKQKKQPPPRHTHIHTHTHTHTHIHTHKHTHTLTHVTQDDQKANQPS